ncbi:ArsR/SmtB family transcription factor [Paludibacterium yongneupense]|uniref:ArsR/SmtB family transcription factor n=1 Tax=Paludibacterium yongneupense TaxID=400061 RepID=UPI00048D7532|nr:metalloregulator ArsR/SmtB family transcription factor [Paludibacterium yongneupense]
MNLSVMNENATRATTLLKSLANEDRLLLLCRLINGEQTVSELERLTGIRQPTLSQQLGVLRHEQLVATRRDGKWIYYRIASQQAQALLKTLHGLYCPAGPGEEMRDAMSRR